MAGGRQATKKPRRAGGDDELRRLGSSQRRSMLVSANALHNGALVRWRLGRGALFADDAGKRRLLPLPPNYERLNIRKDRIRGCHGLFKTKPARC
jgi:hypothetical protein